jgi:hypothetical protein
VPVRHDGWQEEEWRPCATLFQRSEQLGDAGKALPDRTHSTPAAALAYRDAAADQETVVLTLMLMLAKPGKR